MVDTLRRLPWTPPPDPLPEGERARRIRGPIYDLAAVQRLVDGDRIFLATRKCANDVENLNWDVDDVAKLVAALERSDFRNSEWCMGSNGKVIDADAYAIHYDHIGECRSNHLRHPSYYLKFGFRHNDPRLIVWVMICHI